MSTNLSHEERNKLRLQAWFTLVDFHGIERTTEIPGHDNKIPAFHPQYFQYYASSIVATLVEYADFLLSRMYPGEDFEKKIKAFEKELGRDFAIKLDGQAPGHGVIPERAEGGLSDQVERELATSMDVIAVTRDDMEDVAEMMGGVEVKDPCDYRLVNGRRGAISD